MLGLLQGRIGCSTEETQDKGKAVGGLKRQEGEEGGTGGCMPACGPYDTRAPAACSQHLKIFATGSGEQLSSSSASSRSSAGPPSQGRNSADEVQSRFGRRKRWEGGGLAAAEAAVGRAPTAVRWQEASGQVTQRQGQRRFDGGSSGWGQARFFHLFQLFSHLFWFMV